MSDRARLGDRVRQARRLAKLEAAGVKPLRVIAPLLGHGPLKTAAKLMISGTDPLAAMRRAGGSNDGSDLFDKPDFGPLLDTLQADIAVLESELSDSGELVEQLDRQFSHLASLVNRPGLRGRLVRLLLGL